MTARPPKRKPVARLKRCPKCDMTLLNCANDIAKVVEVCEKKLDNIFRLIERWKEWSVTDCEITYEERQSCVRELERALKGKP